MKRNLPTLANSNTPAAAYLRGLQEGNTRNSMRRALQRIAELVSPGSNALELPWHRIRYEHARDIRQRLIQNFAPQTINQSLVAMRGVLKACYYANLMTEYEYSTAISVKNVKGKRPMTGRYVTHEELDRLVNACDLTTPVGSRDAAIIVLLFFGAGLRRSEIGKLRYSDYNWKERTLRVTGKGNRIDIQVLSPEVIRWIENWLEKRTRSYGALFPGMTKHGIINMNKGISGYGVYQMLRRRAGEADIDHISPHDARRTFISNLFDEGVDISTVQGLARHNSPITTTRYDRRGERARRAAVASLNVPVLDEGESNGQK
jgi:integrase